MPGPVRSDEDRGVRVLSAEEAGVVDYDPKRCHALLIAIDDYVDGSGWNDLHCAVRDAEAIGRLLRDEYGFGSVRLLKNEKATRRNILRMLDHYMSLGESDCLVIYYAGHGWMDPQSRSGYWVPADARQGDKYEYVSNSQTIGDYFKRYKAKHLLVLADSCFAGTLLRGAPEPRHEEWTIPSGFQKRSRWIVASGDLSPVPDDGGMGHSPFAQVIIDYLKVGDQSVFGVLDLHTYVRKQLAAAGRQDPVADHLPPPAHVPGGEFVFCRVGKNPPPPPPPPVVGRLEVTSNRDGTVFIGRNGTGNGDEGHGKGKSDDDREPPLSRVMQDWHVTPRVGLSWAFTGSIGVELQREHVALDVGYFPASDGDFWMGGLKIYSNPSSHGWYLGACWGRAHYDTDEKDEIHMVYGMLVGHRWCWPNRWDVSLGIGIGAWQYEDEEDNDEDGIDFFPPFEAAVGYAF